jgi:hypothetical protein
MLIVILALVFVGALSGADASCVSANFAFRDKGDVPFVSNTDLLEVKLEQICVKPDLRVQVRLERVVGLRWIRFNEMEEVWGVVYEGPTKTLPSSRSEFLFDVSGQRLLERGVYRVTVVLSDSTTSVSGCAGSTTLTFVVEDKWGD